MNKKSINETQMNSIKGEVVVYLIYIHDEAHIFLFLNSPSNIMVWSAVSFTKKESLFISGGHDFLMI